MFTGLVEEAGTVVAFEAGSESWRLLIKASAILDGLQLGDSVAVNGCCLTVVELQAAAHTVRFDLLEETVRLTSFSGLKAGDVVNLERSLLPTTRMGGHFVSGHIDCTGTITRFEPEGKDVVLQIQVPASFQKYLVYKGSVAIDGISLTVAEVTDAGVTVWLIPHTLEVTNLKHKEAGQKVNLEFDLVAKYVERLLRQKDIPTR